MKHVFPFLTAFIGTLLISAGFLNVFFSLPGLFARSDTHALAAPAGQTKAEASLVPAQLSIPALDVEAPVQAVGINAEGNMAVTRDYTTAFWYQYGSLPGERGNAVIAGHFDNSLGLPGIFHSLRKLQEGDVVYVGNSRSERLAFRVTRIEHFDSELAPKEEVFRTDGPPQLVLITCEGVWDPIEKSYDKRLVVFAELVP